MKKIILLLCAVILITLTSSVFAQHEDITGLWKSIDDETGEPKSVVKIYLQDGKLYGDIAKLFRKPGEDLDPICDECDEDDSRYLQKINGMTIITKMKFEEDDNEWEDGEILDPKKGSTYNCKLWVEDGKLQVRGYIAFFYRTQEWLRFEEEL